MQRFDITCPHEHPAVRADAFLSELDEPDISRSRAAQLIQEGNVLLNSKPCRKSSTVRPGDSVCVFLPPPAAVTLEAQDIPLDIIYQDDDIAVINKQRGLVVHPAAGHPDGTLVNALLYHLSGLSGINGELRPGIVHRLDRDTTGLIVAAKNDAAHRQLAQQFRDRTCRKEYLALVEGNISRDFIRIDAPLARSAKDRKRIAVMPGGREAITDCTVQERFGTATLVRLLLHTGRTHQIRVHMAHIGHPCLGDPVYGFQKQRFALEGQLLHSAYLEINQPSTGERLSFSAPLPQDFTEVLDTLRAVKKAAEKRGEEF